MVSVLQILAVTGLWGKCAEKPCLGPSASLKTWPCCVPVRHFTNIVGSAQAPEGKGEWILFVSGQTDL